jgi:hypothetical protein
MTLHVHYDHQCPNCEAFYIPYDNEIPCPRCGLVETERFDFISEATASLQFNKANGSYTPGAWYVSSLGDHILMVLFPLFDAYEEPLHGDFLKFAADWHSKMDWGDQGYLGEHILRIAIRLAEALRLRD